MNGRWYHFCVASLSTAPRSTKGRSSPVAVPSEQELMVACPTSGERGSRHLDIVAGRSRGQGRVTEPCVSSRGVVSRCDHTAELPSPETWTSARPPLPQGHSERPGWRPREAGRRRRCSVTKRPAPRLQRVFQRAPCAGRRAWGGGRALPAAGLWNSYKRSRRMPGACAEQRGLASVQMYHFPLISTGRL